MLSNPLAFNRTRRRDDEGFTLIELLVVVVILGILIGIAIPVYLNYRKSANDKAAQSDVRSAVSTLEVCNSDTGYPISITTNAAMSATTNGCTQTITASGGTTLNYFPAGGTTVGSVTSYKVFGTNSGGTTNRYYCYDSTTAGSVKSKDLTAAPTASTTC